jgi:hypothetical protein
MATGLHWQGSTKKDRANRIEKGEWCDRDDEDLISPMSTLIRYTLL